MINILRDRARDYVPIIEQSELPFNAVGGSVSGYNYEDLINGKISIMDNSKKLIIIGQTEFFPISFIYLIGIQ